MYLTIAQEVRRMDREEIMHTVAAACMGTTQAKGEATHRLGHKLAVDLSRYAALFGKRRRE